MLSVDETPVSGRPFVGIGVQIDAYIFDEVNRASGVSEDDLALIARRIQAMRPAVARTFVHVDWFNPSLDGVTFDWTLPGYRHLLRLLRLLRETGTAVNLVLFAPLPALGVDHQALVQGMLAGLERLVAVEGCDHIRWLTLWNEPDNLFFHASPLYRRVFGVDAEATRPAWDAYVHLNHWAYTQLAARGLFPDIRLLVPDTVWGAPMRLERMRLCVDACAGIDVAYGYHNYSTEEQSFYSDNPDFAYAGMAAEVATLRDLLGPDRELGLWEYNTVSPVGFGTFFLGVGPGGEDRVSSFAGAVDVAEKTITGLLHGLDLCCLWCLHDMFYCGQQAQGLMHCGLWRFRWQQWLPRPLFHYYSALMGALRPGMRLYPVSGCPPDLRAIAGQAGDRRVVVLLNTAHHPRRVQAAWNGPVIRHSLTPDNLPMDADLPAAPAMPLVVADGSFACELAPWELSILASPAEA